MAETIEARFKKAVWLNRNGPAEKSSNETKLLFYSYFKQVKFGIGAEAEEAEAERKNRRKRAKAKKRERAIDRLFFSSCGGQQPNLRRPPPRVPSLFPALSIRQR